MFSRTKKLCKFIKWKIYDIRNPYKKRPYGIYCYVGLPGFGKTISMVDKLFMLKSQFPRAKIYTNFGFRYENGSINSQMDLLNINNGEDGVIFGIDELQNTFNSKDWKSFSPEMLSVITQNRKLSKMLLCTAQSFDMIDINFRRICNYIIECRNIGGRWVFQRAFNPEDYKERDGVYNPRRRAWRHSFIADNFIFNSYDTLKVVQSIAKFNQDKYEKKQIIDKKTEFDRKKAVNLKVPVEFIEG